MSYNIEDHKDYLKSEMPYKMSDEQWQRMQQRIKENIIPKNAVPLQKKKRLLRYSTIAGIAAGLILFFVLTTPHDPKTEQSITVYANEKAEQQLDQTIRGLNEDELNWIHELNENDISEQEEYIENQIQL